MVQEDSTEESIEQEQLEVEKELTEDYIYRISQCLLYRKWMTPINLDYDEL